MVIKVPVRTIVACDHFDEPGSEKIKANIQSQFNSNLPEATCERVKKIRLQRYDYVLVDSMVPSASPIAAWIIPLIVYCVKAGIVVLVISAIVWVLNVIGGLVRPPVHCPYCGEAFPDPAALKAHIATAHPQEPQHVCPYCGLSFLTEEELAAHMKECPAKPSAIPWNWIIGGAIVIFGLWIVRELVKKR